MIRWPIRDRAKDPEGRSREDCGRPSDPVAHRCVGGLDQGMVSEQEVGVTEVAALFVAALSRQRT
jgi:hypothetical protein